MRKEVKCLVKVKRKLVSRDFLSDLKLVESKDALALHVLRHTASHVGKEFTKLLQ